MATRKVTVTLPDDQLKQIRKLVASRQADNVSAFVQRAVHNALQDAKSWRQMLDEALEETGGPVTAKERAWADSVLFPRKKAKKRTAA